MRIYTPVEITRIIGVDPTAEKTPGDESITVLTEVYGEETIVIKLTPDVARNLYTAVCEE